MATNNTFVKETLPNAIAFTYGKLKLEIVSQVALGWDTVHAIAFWINEWVLNGGLGFFEVVIKVVTGMWVWVRFGIPPYVYWWHREDSDVP